MNIEFYSKPRGSSSSGSSSKLVSSADFKADPSNDSASKSRVDADIDRYEKVLIIPWSLCQVVCECRPAVDPAPETSSGE